ncbi:hypothetical protein CO046_01775 [Candidatus Peregrinibacteria bacterium CG_4_9_14_0_2_um_filter_53_11]|nr:MAG: hypothetical protein CO046_01775 [Candidatus Peregrinibacteria bacterium CG_4_9_14_0_2_um_filter_53_11]
MDFSSAFPMLLVFIAIVSIVSKLTRGRMKLNVEKSRQQDPLPELSKALELSYKPDPQPADAASDKKHLYTLGGEAHGTYRTWPVQLVMRSTARESDRPGLYRYSYTYSDVRSISMTVKNPSNHSFEIMPRTESIEAAPTGVASFDKALVIVGERIVPSSILEHFGQLGWMHLTLKGETLTMRDDFYSQAQFKGFGAARQLRAVHPVWGISLKHPAADVEKVRAVLDDMVSIGDKLAF